MGAGAGLAGATEGAVFSAVSLVSMLYFFALRWSQSQRTGCTAWGCRYAKTGKLCYEKNRLSLLIALMILFCLFLCLLLLFLDVAQGFQINMFR